MPADIGRLSPAHDPKLDSGAPLRPLYLQPVSHQHRPRLRLALLGTAIGIPIALVVSYSLGSALYQVSPADPTALAGTALLLVAVALLASCIPARRATRVDPMVALRHQ